MHYFEGVYNISMARSKTTAIPVRWQWSHRSPTPSHRYIILFSPKKAEIQDGMTMVAKMMNDVTI